MKGGSKKFLLAAVAIAGLFTGGAVYASTTQVQATANFVSNITLTPSDIQFGNVSFNGTPGAGDKVTVSTSNAATYSGVFQSVGVGGVAAGDIAIAGTFGNTLDISCAVSGTLAQASGAGRINVTTVKVANQSSASGGGVLCSGTGTVVLSFPLTATTDDHLKLGGILDGGSQVSFGAGTYSTLNSGGTPIQVDVAYQ